MVFCLQSCCSAILKAPFTLKESVDGNQAVIDIRRTFAPEPSLPVHIIKGLLCASSVIWLIYSPLTWTKFEDDPRNAFFLVYLTSWATMISAAYMICSMICSLARYFPNADQLLKQPSIKAGGDDSEPEPKPSWLVQLTWFLAAMAYSVEYVITILYWLLVYDGGEISLKLNVMSHGILLGIVAVDVVFVNNIPIRISQLILVEIVGVLFLIWSLIFAKIPIDDGIIYGVLDWNEDPQSAIIMSIMLLLVFAPICFILGWLISMYGPLLACTKSEGKTTRRRVIISYPQEAHLEQA